MFISVRSHLRIFFINLRINVYQQTLTISRVNNQYRQLDPWLLPQKIKLTEISHTVLKLWFLQRWATCMNEEIMYTKPMHTWTYSLTIRKRKQLMKRGGIQNGVPSRYFSPMNLRFVHRPLCINFYFFLFEKWIRFIYETIITKMYHIINNIWIECLFMNPLVDR